MTTNQKCALLSDSDSVVVNKVITVSVGNKTLNFRKTIAGYFGGKKN